VRARPLLAVAALAVLLRLVHLLAVSATPILSYHQTFAESDMYLFDQWAHRIANGDVLGRQVYHPLNAWQLDSAPSEKWKAWYGESPVFYKAPLFPYLVAALYRLPGDTMVLLALLQILAAAASAVLLGRITGQIFGPTAGLCAALVYAVYAPDIHFDVVMLRGPWIILVSLLATWLLLGLHVRPTAGRAVGLGMVVGIAILVNEAFLTVPPLITVVVLVWFLREPRRLAILLGGFALGMVGAGVPVVIRNVIVGASALKLAVTGSTVYAVFNSAGSSPYFFQIRPATFVPIIEASGGDLLATVLGCLRSFASVRDILAFYLGKVAGLVIPFENPDNANVYYAALTSPLLGVLPNYSLLLPASVVGLALAARRLREWVALLPFALALLVSILIALPLSRYRATLAVYLIPFAALALAEALAFARARRLAPLTAVVLGGGLVFVAAGVLQDRVVFAGVPRAFHYYRPAEFLLGANVYERQGRLADASHEALSLARLNPHAPTKATALLVMGRLEALRGHTPAAGQALAAARQLDGANPWLLQALGDVYTNPVGDRVAAADCYRDALRLGVPEPARRALQERLRLLEQPPPVK
jgi:4-amino-4-deoxy-L-arabinose transferase-like glycosyltransferase